MKCLPLLSFLLLTAVVSSAEPAKTNPAAPQDLRVLSVNFEPAAQSPKPPKLKVVKADSEETGGEEGQAANAVDGNTNSIWHTQWQDESPACPHEIILELSEATAIKGFTYLPRQDDSDHGGIKEYEFSVSDDGKDFGKPVKTGEFSAGKEMKTVAFDGKKCRFIKLRALSEINGEPWTSAAEIGIVLAD